MPLAETHSFNKRLERAQKQVGSAQRFRIVTTVEVVDRGPADQPEVIETIPDLDLLIDAVDGIRILRRDVHPDELHIYDEEAESFERIDITVTLHPGQVEAYFDEGSDIIGILGGQRAGKTAVMARWLFRQWMLRGYEGALFWWVSDSLEHTRVAVRKYITGEQGRPGIMPPELWVSYPETDRSGDQAIVMLDGSRFELKHGRYKGDNLKAVNIEAGAVDEITSIKHVENWRVLSGRTLDADAPLFVASTPKAGHWAHEEIILKAEEYPGEIAFHEFSSFKNPFVPLEVVWKKLKKAASLSNEVIAEIRKIDDLDQQIALARKATTDPTTLRDFFGEWAAEGVMLWTAYKAKVHMVTGPGYEAGAFGFVDLTDSEAGPWFLKRLGKGVQYIGGQDFNIEPMTTLVAQVVDTPNGPGLLFLDEIQTVGNIHVHAEHLLKYERYLDIPIACDVTGCRRGTHANQGAKDGETLSLILREAGYAAFPCNYRQGKPVDLPKLDSVHLMQRMLRQDRIRVHKRCTELRRALSTQQSTAKGEPDKESGKASDRLSSTTDAARYMVWAVFHREWKEVRQNVRDRKSGRADDGRPARDGNRRRARRART